MQTISKKVCLKCHNEFVGDNSICPSDGTVLTVLTDQLEPGMQLLGRYEIIGLLGGGAYGFVYKAKQISTDRVVAVKVLNHDLVNEIESVKRFKLEAKAASLLNDPHIVSIVDFDRTEDGITFMVMDYLEGETLSDILEREHRLPLDRALSIFSQACAGIGHAHDKGVLHRDLKPSNIMIIKTGGQEDFVKIVDFGIAKLMPSAEVQATQLTRAGEVFGSPLYMSPEQCRGKTLDQRTDIYSLGSALYLAITGRPLFEVGQLVEVLMKQVTEMPKSFDEVCPELHIPVEVEDTVFKAIAKPVQDRFQTVHELRTELDRLREKLRADKNTSSMPSTSAKLAPVGKMVDDKFPAAAGSQGDWRALLKGKNLVIAGSVLLLLIALVAATSFALGIFEDEASRKERAKTKDEQSVQGDRSTVMKESRIKTRSNHGQR